MEPKFENNHIPIEHIGEGSQNEEGDEMAINDEDERIEIFFASDFHENVGSAIPNLNYHHRCTRCVQFRHWKWISLYNLDLICTFFFFFFSFGSEIYIITKFSVVYDKSTKVLKVSNIIIYFFLNKMSSILSCPRIWFDLHINNLKILKIPV